MIEKELRDKIIAMVHREVVPAIGCTEPMCVALCTAKATEKLGCRPEKIEALLSANILKNAMGVGIHWVNCRHSVVAWWQASAVAVVSPI
jgi:L-cysteine desulfidase